MPAATDCSLFQRPPAADDNRWSILGPSPRHSGRDGRPYLSDLARYAHHRPAYRRHCHGAGTGKGLGSARMGRRALRPTSSHCSVRARRQARDSRVPGRASPGCPQSWLILSLFRRQSGSAQLRRTRCPGTVLLEFASHSRPVDDVLVQVVAETAHATFRCLEAFAIGRVRSAAGDGSAAGTF
jgi:hypothetical protein